MDYTLFSYLSIMCSLFDLHVQATEIFFMAWYRQYREYLEKLLEYLVYFFERTEPLQDLDRIFSKVQLEWYVCF